MTPIAVASLNFAFQDEAVIDKRGHRVPGDEGEAGRIFSSSNTRLKFGY